MENILEKVFTSHSYILEEPIFNSIFNKLNDKEKEELAKIDELFKKFNKHITMKDILHIIYKLETNAFIIDNALQDKDNELAFHIKALNQETIKLINDLFIMLERKKITYEE